MPTSPNHLTHIPEGYTYEYLPHGFFLGITGLILTFTLHWSLFPIALAGIFIAASKTGIEIQTRTKQMRKYTSWIVFKTGEWIDLTNLERIELEYDDHGGDSTYVMEQRHTSAKTFDLLLITKKGKTILFNQFLKIGLALKTVDALEALLPELTINNYVLERLKS